MTPLEREIHTIIRRDGPITVADYMALALGHPEHGYYRSGDPFGADGDFITAPEISQVFGELLGLWCAVTWRQMGAPARVRLVELGPGRGTLMVDVLRAAATVPKFFAAAELHLVETSPALRARQRQALGRLPVTWHETFDGVPDGPMLLLANEFFDALPVQQFVRDGGAWRRRRVDIDGTGNGLCFVVSSDTAADADLPAAAGDAPDGAVCEICCDGLALAAKLGRRLTAHGGAALIIDYGPAQSAAGESLQAVRGHRPHHVLSAPGTADLTAHVDFEALAVAAGNAGAVAHGPVLQGAFLTRLGIAARADGLCAGATADQAREIRSGCRRLTDPTAMGMLFKAMALCAPGLPVPAGFER